MPVGANPAGVTSSYDLGRCVLRPSSFRRCLSTTATGASDYDKASAVATSLIFYYVYDEANSDTQGSLPWQ